MNTKLNILLKQIQTSDEVERKRLEIELWNRVAAEGSPLLRMQENGRYQVTFLYRAANAKTVSLSSADLYDKMQDEDGNVRPFEKISGTDTFVLHFDNIPSDAFATYNLMVNGKTIGPDPANQKFLSMHSLDIQSQRTLQHQTSYIQLPDAQLPDWSKLNPKRELNGSVHQETFVDPSKTFPDREVWTYRPENFNPSNGKLLFMLDGESFVKTTTPYVDTMSTSQESIFANTAIVFINSGLYDRFPPPGRVIEYYIERDGFSKFLAEQVIPNYCLELGIKNKENVILAAHSLAAYPTLDVAKKYTNEVGGIILLSPALNQNKKVDLPTDPDPSLRALPIFMQIGQLEDIKPPKVEQGPKDMQNKSRLESNSEFHQELTAHHYHVQSPLTVHSSGHDLLHCINGIMDGLKFIEDRHLSHSKEFKEPIASTTYKNQLKEIIGTSSPQAKLDEPQGPQVKG